MPGPPPKDPTIRQRRNTRATTATLPPAAVAAKRAKVPPLPKRAGKKRKPWHAMTRQWWNDVWHSPMASKYLTADMHGLYVLAELVDQFWHEPTPERSREIRLHRTAYGITPLDRWRLQWSILEKPSEAPPNPAPAPPKAPSSSSPAAEDPRTLLFPRRA
jgi:hypothetical protein